MAYRKKFDAKTYWSHKPLCEICKVHKVKTGAVCYLCRQAHTKTQPFLDKEKGDAEKEMSI